MDSLAFRRSLIRAFGGFHAWAYKSSRGRWGGLLLGLPIVLLHLVGRKTGKPRPTPLLYMKDGEDVVIVASYYGSAVKKGISKLSAFLDDALKGGPVDL